MGIYLGNASIGAILPTGLGYLKYCTVEQIISGNTCELVITESATPTEYVIGYLVRNDEISLYILKK